MDPRPGVCERPRRWPVGSHLRPAALIAALLGAGVLILVIVLLATGALGGDDDSARWGNRRPLSGNGDGGERPGAS